MSMAKAIQTMRRDEVKKKLEAAAAKEPAAITGKFDVIVVDPPWPIKKIERDCRPNQVETDYPTMTEDEILSFSLPSDPAKHCHLFLWTTQKFLPLAFQCLEAWGFKYTFTMVWHKPGGIQPTGLPQFNCEFILYGRKGSPCLSRYQELPNLF